DDFIDYRDAAYDYRRIADAAGIEDCAKVLITDHCKIIRAIYNAVPECRIDRPCIPKRLRREGRKKEGSVSGAYVRGGTVRRYGTTACECCASHYDFAPVQSHHSPVRVSCCFDQKIELELVVVSDPPDWAADRRKLSECVRGTRLRECGSSQPRIS